MECRICFGDEHPQTMLIPCRCRGSSAYVHDRCLRTYFSYYPDRLCRVCHERMGHPWLDTERNYTCATTLLVWAAVLLTLSAVHPILKVLAFIGFTMLVLVHVRRQQLTYELTFACLAVSGLLFMSDPVVLPQTIFLAAGLLMLLMLCIFVPVETVLLVLVVSLALTYSVLLTFSVAVRTDPAFAGLFLLLMIVFWMTFVRPQRANEVYP